MPSRQINLSDKELGEILASSLSDVLKKKIDRAFKKRSARYGKNKGASFQLWVAGQIGEMLGIEWDNQDDESPIQARQMGGHGVDIILRSVAAKKFPYSIECKAVESLNVADAIQQAEDNEHKGRDWLLVWKKKGFKNPVAVLSLPVFLALAKLYAERLDE